MLAFHVALALIASQDAGLQDPPAIVWAAPVDPVARVAVPESSSAPTLPDWALADPYAWERAECSPLVRGAETLEACQARVRITISAALGDKTPAGMAPRDGDADCARMIGGQAGDYALVCDGNRERLASANAYAREREERSFRCSETNRRFVSPIEWNRTCGSPVDTGGQERDIDQLRPDRD